MFHDVLWKDALTWGGLKRLNLTEEGNTLSLISASMCVASFCGASANPLGSLVPQSQALRSMGLSLFRLWPNSRCSPRALGLFSMLRFRTLASQREIVSYLPCPSSKHHGLETQSWRPKYSFAPLSPRKILIQAEAKEDLFFFFFPKGEKFLALCALVGWQWDLHWTLKCVGLFSWNLSSSEVLWDLGLRIDDGRIINFLTGCWSPSLRPQDLTSRGEGSHLSSWLYLSIQCWLHLTFPPPH